MTRQIKKTQRHAFEHFLFLKNFRHKLGKARQLFKDRIDLFGHTNLKMLAVNEA